jgi:hypothetical protein
MPAKHLAVEQPDGRFTVSDIENEDHESPCNTSEPAWIAVIPPAVNTSSAPRRSSRALVAIVVP